MICYRFALIDRQSLFKRKLAFFAFSLNSFLTLLSLCLVLCALARGVASGDWSNKSRGFVPPSHPLHASQSNMWARGRAGLTRIATSVTWPQMTAVAFSPPPSSLFVVVKTIEERPSTGSDAFSPLLIHQGKPASYMEKLQLFEIDFKRLGISV